MRIFKWISIIILIPIIALGLFLLYAGITNYSPDKQIIQSEIDQVAAISDTINISLVSWNIGYSGLDKGMDFFYDGGEKVMPSKEKSLNNLNGIINALQKYSDFDFVLLQEVDVKSKRSYRVNQYDIIGSYFSGYSSNMGTNYKVNFIPIPPSKPLGKVHSGVATYSKYQPAKSVRHSFEGNYSWPMNLFMLDRCFLVNEYPIANGKKLFVINTHNSAYDDGSLRSQQMDYLKTILSDLYSNGNYVIVGGDWNQCPNGFTPSFKDDVFDEETLIYIDKDYPEANWKWAFDSSIPTNRRLKNAYNKGETLTTVIDFFLLSPNIEIEHINGRELGFEFSDHQPVELIIKLLPN